MKIKSLLTIIASSLALLLTSCFEVSSVVKVNKDGSGILHMRNYTNTDGAGLGGLLGGLGADEGEKEEEAVEMPSKEELEEMAAMMGEGVELKEIKESTNKAGWKGYETIFTIKDINTFKMPLGLDDLKGMGGDMAASMDATEEEEPKEEFLEFRFKKAGLMKKSELTIITPDYESGKEKEEAAADEDDATADPFGGDAAAGGDMGMMAMMAPMLKGARMGVFVQVEGEVTKSNALHQKGNMTTLLQMDLSKLFSNTEALGKMEDLESSDREKIQEIADSIDGVTMDVQKEITIEFK